MQTSKSANGFISIGLNFGITLLCIYPTWIVLSELTHSHEVQDVEEIPDVAETIVVEGEK